MIRSLVNYLFIVILFIKFSNSQNDIDMHSSITTLQDVLQTEKIMFNNLEKFIEQSELKIIGLKEFINDHEPLFENSNTLNSKNFSDNPLGKIITLRKFLRKSDLFELLLADSPKTDLKNFTRFQFEHSYPTNEDLEGMIKSIVRLQEVYDLSANDIIKDCRINVSSSDLFQIGYGIHQLDEHKFATEWFNESLNRLNIEEDKFKESNDKIKILDFLSVSKWREGGLSNSLNAIKIAEEILLINPDDENIKKKIKLFRNPGKKNKNIKPYLQNSYYKLGCQGKFTKSPAEQKKLYCKYQTTNHPFLKISPIKKEILNLNPPISIYYDILYDSEISILKNLSKPKLIRAQIFNSTTGKGSKTDYRISKYTFFGNYSTPIIHKINQRISDMTGLTVETSERLQVINYGMGGHYGGHSDAYVDPSENKGFAVFPRYDWGNRFATVLFYLSDVEKGGATTFPNIRVSSFPKKGAAIAWPNLYRDGKTNRRTNHAGCPVLLGSKWVSNKWIRYNGQIFRKPCRLFPDSIDDNVDSDSYF